VATRRKERGPIKTKVDPGHDEFQRKLEEKKSSIMKKGKKKSPTPCFHTRHKGEGGDFTLSLTRSNRRKGRDLEKRTANPPIPAAAAKKTKEEYVGHPPQIRGQRRKKCLEKKVVEISSKKREKSPPQAAKKKKREG